jgi:hypothetical protein
MRIYARHLYRLVLVGSAAVALSCAPGGAWAQQNNSQDQTQAQGQAQGQAQVGNFRSADWVAFNQFLDAHPGIAAALRTNPDLLSDDNFLSQHNDLKTFCDNHPQVRQDMDRDRPQFRTWFRYRHQVAAMDQFLDSHPYIDNQLEANPSLIDNKSFVQSNAALQDFLNSNPQVRQAFDQNPNLFMRAETRFEGTRADVRGDLAIYTQFAKDNPNLAKQLEANPSLINDSAYVDAHVSLKTFLSDHPDVQQQIAQNPALFFQMEARYDNGQGAMGAGGYGQNGSTNPNTGRNGNPDTDRNANADLTRGEVASMDQFLDSHQSIEQQLQANPSLITNQTFLSDHPQLQSYLNQHPQVAAEFAENPQYFMLRTNRYEGSPADQRADNNAVNRNPSPDLTRAQVASMDQFLDSHQSIEQQLQANPSLITNQNFLRNHPQLQSFLNDHPNIQAEFAENPQYFILRVRGYEGTPADQRADNNVNRNPNPDRDRNGNGNPDTDRNANPDLTRGEVASMDQFLDSHPDIEKQLQANPSLINNVSYLSKHPALRAYLSNHAQVREEFTENPSLFMQREGQYENTEYRNGEARYYNGSRSMNQQDVATMDAYLDKHASEARDLQAYPARVNDSDYLSHHKDLESFFKKHPQVREEFTTNPSAFMGAESTFEADSEMDEFLNNHKKLAKDLDENPDRVKDNDYLNHHKDLKSFLEKNPGVNDQFEDNPRAFMNREKRFDTDRDFDVYLTKHRNVAKDLQKDPDRVKDEKYLNKHKDLKELMEKHPDLDQRAKMNPSGLMQEQMKFHEDYKNHQIHEKSKVEQRANVHPH